METDSVASPNARSPSGAMRVSVTRYEYGAAAPPAEVRRSCYSPEIRDLPRQLNVGTNSVDAHGRLNNSGGQRTASVQCAPIFPGTTRNHRSTQAIGHGTCAIC